MDIMKRIQFGLIVVEYTGAKGTQYVLSLSEGLCLETFWVAAVVEWLSSWLAEQEVLPGLAT